MAANTSQIFSRLGEIQWVASGLGANTAMDGTGTVATVFTADATVGNRIERVNIINLGANVASLLRFFINNGSSTTVAANNSLIEEVPTALNSLSQTAASTPLSLIRVPIVLKPGYRLTVAVATAVASGFQITAFGGVY